MKLSLCGVAMMAGAWIASVGEAQTGVLDQISPFPAPFQEQAVFICTDPAGYWQQQVRAGISGQLDGIGLMLHGSLGSHITVNIRAGNGWSTGPVLFTGFVTKSGNAIPEYVYLSTNSANLYFVSGAKFVIELIGQNDGGALDGSYVAPPGAPHYSQPMFVNITQPSCYMDCGFRIAFQTYVIADPAPFAYCTAGTSTNGCQATITASANPRVTYSTPCGLTVSNVEGQKSGIVFYGLTQTVQPWCTQGGGSSFLCVKAPTMRTGAQNSGGVLNACDGTLALDWNNFEQSHPGALGAPWSAGQRAYVQAWYRDPPSCKTTSLSNALALTYLP